MKTKSWNISCKRTFKNIHLATVTGKVKKSTMDEPKFARKTHTGFCKVTTKRTVSNEL